MEYKEIVEGEFIARPNRFIAEVIINNKLETVHVKNTGKCKELLVPGAKVYLEVCEDPKRKTKYDLVMVEKAKDLDCEPLLINMDSQVPNKVVLEFLRNGTLFGEVSPTRIRPETTYGKSRFDFYVEVENRKIFLEVKGVTLEENSRALFPDAKTLRGVKHVEELIASMKEGYEAYILFLIQMKGPVIFLPNDATHLQFGDALRRAKQEGVKILAFDSEVWKKGIRIGKELPVDLEQKV